jgi:murein DD-endopeptidase MepM/ murein hydrolase activator NlpD
MTLKRSNKSRIIAFVGGMCLLLLVVMLFFQLEGEKPDVLIGLPADAIGAQNILTLTVSDQKSGVRRLWASLSQGDREVILMDHEFPGSVLWGGGHKKEQVTHELAPKLLGLKDGRAQLRVLARDYAWRGWLRGNKTYIEKEVTIDTQPPVVDVLTQMHNINQGGAGVVVYRLSEPCEITGVAINDNLYPAYAGYFDDASIYICFFALAHNHDGSAQVLIKAEDAAGNVASAGFTKYIKKKAFKKDTIRLSDRFFEAKLPEFNVGLPPGVPDNGLEKFLVINRELRRENTDQILNLAATSDPLIHWQGKFLRMPNSQRMAGFADHRTYLYKDEVVDHQMHMGVDLAGNSHDPVPAANRGRVVYSGELGIYGQAVLIDHGFSLFSMYGHLSRLDVEAGQMVERGQTLGLTGTTGMAGGDHLHFSMLVHNTFVNPIEWWDERWIKHNVTDKIAEVQTHAGKRS